MSDLDLISRGLGSLTSILRLVPTVLVLMTLVATPLPLETLTTHAAALPCEPAWRPMYSPEIAASGNIWQAAAMISSQDGWVVGIGFDGNKTIATSAHWNGRKWKSVAMPSIGDFQNTLYSVDGLAPDDVWAAGIYRNQQDWQAHFFLHWNGVEWRHIPSPQIAGGESGIRGITAISSDNVWAAGYQVQNPLAQRPIVQKLVMHWDGSEWKMIDSPNPDTQVNELLSISGRFPDDIWAVGRTVEDSGMSQPLALHYDGTAWNVVSTPHFGSGYNVLTDVETIFSYDAWAVGQYVDPVTDRRMNLVLHWDGSKWNVIPTSTPHPSIYEFPLRAVTAVSENDIWVVGSDYRPKKGFALALILRWSGTDWTRAPVQSLGDWSNNLADIAAAGTNDLWAVGYYTGVPPRSIPLVQHYGPQIARPKAIAPAKNATVATRKVFLDWQDNDCADLYEVVVKHTNAQGSIAYARKGLSASQVKTSKLTRDEKYVWSVRGCNDDGCGFWSNWRAFQVAP